MQSLTVGVSCQLVNEQDDTIARTMPSSSRQRTTARSSSGTLSYVRLLQEYPLATMTIQTVALQCLAKLMCTIIVSHSFPTASDFATQALVAALFLNPMLMIFGNFLQFGCKHESLATKLAIDQLVFSPCFTISLITIFDLASGANFDLNSVLTRAIATMPFSWSFWIPQRGISLSFVPPLFQLPVNSACSFVWAVIFSYLRS